MAILGLSSCAKNWSYEGSSSPEFWHKINKEYKFCKIGHNQSPVDIINQKFNKIDFEDQTHLKAIEDYLTEKQLL